MSSTTAKQVLSLYKQLLETSIKFENYNFREFARRKVRDTFKENKDLSDQKDIRKFYNEGINNLEMLKRQTTISQMFTFDKLVVEPLNKHH